MLLGADPNLSGACAGLFPLLRLRLLRLFQKRNRSQRHASEPHDCLSAVNELRKLAPFSGGSEPAASLRCAHRAPALRRARAFVDCVWCGSIVHSSCQRSSASVCVCVCETNAATIVQPQVARSTQLSSSSVVARLTRDGRAGRRLMTLDDDRRREREFILCKPTIEQLDTIILCLVAGLAAPRPSRTIAPRP